MGGYHSKLISVWAVFFFVAIWHDIEWKLIAWGLLNSGFYVLEICGKAITRTSSYQSILPPLFKTVTETSASALYIMVLIFVNLVGYSVGVAGMSSITGKFFTAEGAKTLAVSFYFLFWGARLMSFIQEVRFRKSHEQ